MHPTAEMFERLREVEDTSQRNSLGLQSHERECALRYGYLNASITSMRNILLWIGSVLLVGMASLLVKVLFFHGAP